MAVNCNRLLSRSLLSVPRIVGFCKAQASLKLNNDNAEIITILMEKTFGIHINLRCILPPTPNEFKSLAM